MPIYTKTGDLGGTSLYGGKRVLKSDLQVEAYGAIDELSSFIGLVIVKIKNQEQKEYLTQVQKDLYNIMAVLAGDKDKNLSLENRVISFEKQIDAMEKKLSPLHHFILPQGTEISGWFQILRVICRRTERKVVAFYKLSEIKKLKLTPIQSGLKIIIKYLNRLSDLFFILARYYNKEKEIEA